MRAKGTHKNRTKQKKTKYFIQTFIPLLPKIGIYKKKKQYSFVFRLGTSINILQGLVLSQAPSYLFVGVVKLKDSS